MKTQTMKTNETALAALASHLGCQPEELIPQKWDTYGLPTYSLGREEYALAESDEIADAAAKEYIESSLWAFNSSFICQCCHLPSELAGAIGSWQQKECESANDTLLELISKHCHGGVDGFAAAAIGADGRGHFLASYDGDEIELPGGAFAYRIN